MAVHAGIPVITRHDVDEMLAREYPAMLEDLALRVENILDSDVSLVAAGTAGRLQERVVKLKEQPWLEEQQIALERLENAIKALESLEQERPFTPPPGSVPPMAE